MRRNIIYTTDCKRGLKTLPDNSVNCSEPMRKIKEFMALYGIVDINMRMLRIRAFKQIIGFPANYKLIGTQADQKKFIGNAVEVNMARVLCEALVEELHTLKKAA